MIDKKCCIVPGMPGRGLLTPRLAQLWGCGQHRSESSGGFRASKASIDNRGLETTTHEEQTEVSAVKFRRRDAYAYAVCQVALCSDCKGIRRRPNSQVRNSAHKNYDSSRNFLDSASTRTCPQSKFQTRFFKMILSEGLLDPHARTLASSSTVPAWGPWHAKA